MDLDSRITICERFRTRDDIPGTILWFCSGTCFVLNETASSIFKGIVNNLTPRQIIEQLQKTHPNTKSVGQDVIDFLQKLKESGVIT